jgi:predicted transcriptional regulator
LKKGITQEDLATNTDSKTHTIQRIENDEVKLRGYTIQRIAVASAV